MWSISIVRISVTGLFLVIVFGCASDSENPVAVGNREGAIVETATETFIIDKTGKQWDITYARHKYGMEPAYFEFGLGQNAILPVMTPVMIAPGENLYPGDDEDFPVIATVIESDARAYRFGKMAITEVVNETIADTDVAVGYCPLVDLAAVYPRKVEGQTLTFGASGWTYKKTFVLYDHQTESLWYHLNGTDGLTGVDGFYKNFFLKSFDTFKTRWNDWKQQYSGSLIMSDDSR